MEMKTKIHFNVHLSLSRSLCLISIVLQVRRRRQGLYTEHTGDRRGIYTGTLLAWPSGKKKNYLKTMGTEHTREGRQETVEMSFESKERGKKKLRDWMDLKI